MVAKTKNKTKRNKYTVVSAGGKQKTITAKNIQEAYAKAKRLFPRARLVTVSREPSKKGTD